MWPVDPDLFGIFILSLIGAALEWWSMSVIRAISQVRGAGLCEETGIFGSDTVTVGPLGATGARDELRYSNWWGSRGLYSNSYTLSTDG